MHRPPPPGGFLPKRKPRRRVLNKERRDDRPKRRQQSTTRARVTPNHVRHLEKVGNEPPKVHGTFKHLQPDTGYSPVERRALVAAELARTPPPIDPDTPLTTQAI